MDLINYKSKENWTLQLGHTCAQYLEDIGGNIDFIGDIALLNKGGYVVLHDIALHERYDVNSIYNCSNGAQATCVAFNTLCGEKILCLDEEGRLPNIGAIKITEDTIVKAHNLFGKAFLDRVQVLKICGIKDFDEFFKRIVFIDINKQK